jgi:hypothetical protein
MNAKIEEYRLVRIAIVMKVLYTMVLILLTQLILDLFLITECLFLRYALAITARRLRE